MEPAVGYAAESPRFMDDDDMRLEYGPSRQRTFRRRTESRDRLEIILRDIIDVDDIDLEDEQTWLCMADTDLKAARISSEGLLDWLRQDADELYLEDDEDDDQEMDEDGPQLSGDEGQGDITQGEPADKVVGMQQQTQQTPTSTELHSATSAATFSWNFGRVSSRIRIPEVVPMAIPLGGFRIDLLKD